MGLDFLANVFGASTILMSIFAAKILGGGPRTLGWLLSAPAVGSVAGVAVMASRRPMSRPGVGILATIVVYGFGLTAFAISRNLWLSLACLAASGAADSVSISQRHSLRNLLTPDRLRGRVAAAHDTFAGGSPQLGELEAGVVATWTSAPTAVAVGGMGTVIAALAIWRWIPGLARFQWAPGTVGKGANSPQEPSSVGKSIDERGPGSI